MNNKIFCSTGTIVGRVNGFNYRLFTDNHREIVSDGFELMMVHAYYPILSDLSRDIERSGANIEVLHAEKDIGGLLTQSDPDAIKKAFSDFEINCALAESLGAKKVVFHLWSAPDSDRFFDKNLSYLPYFVEISEKHRVTLLIENVPCAKSDPFKRLCEIEAKYPDVRFIFDTRFGAFHEQTDKFLESPWIVSGKISHMHFSDYTGPAHAFSSLRPIPHLGDGIVGFDRIMPIISGKYNGSITLESPEIREDASGIDKINRDLSFIRKWVKK